MSVSITELFFRIIHFAAALNYLHVQPKYIYFTCSKNIVHILSQGVSFMLEKTFAQLLQVIITCYYMLHITYPSVLHCSLQGYYLRQFG